MSPDRDDAPTPRWPRVVVACAGAVGLILAAQAALASSATYDEVAYLRIASDWWRTGRADRITRMGSPLTFFKLQHAPAFFVLDRVGLGHLVDRPILAQATLLPIVRLGSLWIWLAAFGLTVAWSRRVYGEAAMAFAACLFALSPNLLAHGSIATMEMPLVAATAATFFAFWRFLETGRRGPFVAAATAGGLAFSCKFTAVLYPPILGLIWAGDLWRRGERDVGRMARSLVPGMAGYVAILLVADLAVTGFAVISPSERRGDHPSAPGLGWLLETPMPQDWVGFATQIRHQRGGGPSYLLGERRMTGWWSYYPVALAVKVPIACLVLLATRLALATRAPSTRRDWIFPTTIALFLAVAMLGSKRNYGVRYLLPMAPLAIAWVSGLAASASRGRRWIVGLGLAGQATAVAGIHPHELSYFNVVAGGKVGGRRVLADSNLDWGQGLRSLARLEARYRPLTVFYFGDTDPIHYGVEADAYLIRAAGGPGGDDRPPRDLPATFRVDTRYVAVSASLQHGPWGPEGYFRPLDPLTPAAYTDDGTIAIYDVGGQDLSHGSRGFSASGFPPSRKAESQRQEEQRAKCRGRESPRRILERFGFDRGGSP